MPSESQPIEEVVIAREEIEGNISQAVAILGETRKSTGIDEARCRWMYLDNPDGHAQLWTARAQEDGRMVGFAAVLPRRMWIKGELRRAWNTADLSVAGSHRRRGIASALRQAAGAAVDAGEVDLLYGHPNRKSEGAHKKAGFTGLGEMQRYAVVLKTAPYLQRMVRSRRVSQTVGLVADPILRLRNRELRRSSNITTREVLRAGAGFDELDRECLHNVPIIGVRDATYVNWRYVDNPSYRCSLWIAESGERMSGFAVLRDRGTVGEILDIYPATDPTVVDELLRALFQVAQSRGYESLSATLLEHNPCIDNLRRFGFRQRRERSNMYAHCVAGCAWHDAATRGSSWYVWEGDRDL